MRSCRTLIVNHIAGDVSGENSRISGFLSEGKKENPQREGLDPSHGVAFPVAQRFCCLLNQRSCHSVLRLKPDGVSGKIDDSIWLLCLFIFPFAEALSFPVGDRQWEEVLVHANGEICQRKVQAVWQRPPPPNCLLPGEGRQGASSFFASVKLYLPFG